MTSSEGNTLPPVAMAGATSRRHPLHILCFRLSEESLIVVAIAIGIGVLSFRYKKLGRVDIAVVVLLID
jgi:hypothetical protein